MRFTPQYSFRLAASTDPQVQIKSFFAKVGNRPLTYARIFGESSNDDTPANSVPGSFNFSPNFFGKNTTYLSSVADNQTIHLNSGDLIIEESVGDNVCIYSAGGGDVIILGSMGDNNCVYTEGEFKAGVIGANNEISAHRIIMAGTGHGCNLSAKRTVYLNRKKGVLGRNSMVQGLNAVIETLDTGAHVVVKKDADIGFAGKLSLVEAEKITIHHDAHGEALKASQKVVARDIGPNVCVDAPEIEAKYVSRDAELVCEGLNVRKFYASNAPSPAANDSSHKPVRVFAIK